MKAQYLFVGGPMDGVRVPFETAIPQRIKISRQGTMIQYHDDHECEWPYYSLIPYSSDPELAKIENCIGKFIYVEQCDLLDSMLKELKAEHGRPLPA